MTGEERWTGQFQKAGEEEIPEVSRGCWHKQRKRGREENEFPKFFSGQFTQNYIGNFSGLVQRSVPIQQEGPEKRSCQAA